MNRKPVVLVVMDGVGKTDKDLGGGNMVLHAHTPTLDEMMRLQAEWSSFTPPCGAEQTEYIWERKTLMQGKER